MAQDQPTLEGLTADVKVTTERLDQLEGAQIAAEERLKAIEDAQVIEVKVSQCFNAIPIVFCRSRL